MNVLQDHAVLCRKYDLKIQYMQSYILSQSGAKMQ